jgi:YggT family protein
MPTVLVLFIQMLAFVFWLLLIVRVIMSWVMPRGGGSLVAFVYQATEPILAPIRRVLPPAAGIDWSPLIAMLILGAITRAVTSIAR